MEQRSRKNLPIHIVKRDNNSSDLQFWLHKTPQERIDAVESLRKQYYSLCGCSDIPRITQIIQVRAYRT